MFTNTLLVIFFRRVGGSVTMSAASSGRMGHFIRAPVGIRRVGHGLSGSEIVCGHGRENEILGRNRIPVQPTQESELANMSHRIRERALKKLVILNARRERLVREVGSQRLECRMEALDLFGEVCQSWRLERTTVKHGPGVADQSCHVPEQLVRRTRSRRCAEVGKIRRRAAKRFLRAVSQRGEKVAKESTGFSHGAMCVAT